MCPNSIVFNVTLVVATQKKIVFSVTSEAPLEGINSITFIKNTGVGSPVGTIVPNQGLVIYDDPADFQSLYNQVQDHTQFCITVTYDDNNNVCNYSVITNDLLSVARGVLALTERLDQLLLITKNHESALKAIEEHLERSPGSGSRVAESA